MARLIYPASGLVRPGVSVGWQRADQGRDLVIGGAHVLQAPGHGVCVGVDSDNPFPNGFGPNYPRIRFDSGPFKHPQPWYFGHTSSLVSPGEVVHFGQPICVANQSEHVAGWPAGWVEVGQQQPDGRLGPNSPGGHWFDGLLSRPLVVNVPDPVLHGPSRPGGHDFSFGKNVWLLLWRLHYVDSHARLGLGYSSNVVNWVRAFEKRHKLHRQDGACGSEAWLAIKYAAAACKHTRHPEV